MGRGRRKGRPRKAKENSAAVPGHVLVEGPKEKDSKMEFSGMLSHSSPLLKEIQITNYFPPVISLLQEENPVTEGRVPSISETQANGASQIFLTENSQSNTVVTRNCEEVSGLSNENINTDHGDKKEVPSPLTPHKIQYLGDAHIQHPLSPSTALSKLKISCSPKKSTYSKTGTKARRLITCQNQHSGLAQTKMIGSEMNHKLTEYFPVRRSERRPKTTILEEKQKNIEDAILSKRDEGLKIRHFPGKGRGVVATQLFRKGEFVVEYAGELIEPSLAQEREKTYAQDQNTGCYMYYFKYKGQQYCLDATAESSRLGRLVNHSRLNSNLVTKPVLVESTPHLILIAKSDIRPGEEVLYDYGDRSKDSLKYHPWLAL